MRGYSTWLSELIKYSEDVAMAIREMEGVCLISETSLRLQMHLGRGGVDKTYLSSSLIIRRSGAAKSTYHQPTGVNVVKEVTKVFHQCEICKAEHATDAEAKRCEKRGVKPYDFAKYEVVRYTHVGALLNRLPPSKRLLVVDSPVDEDWAPQHGDVERYSVEWFDKMKLEGGTFHHQRTNMDVRLINMVKARYTKKRCPLCSSTDVASFVKDMYFHQSAVNADTETLRNVETTKCQNCGVIYFTELQRLTMLRSFDEAVSEEKSRKKPTLQGFLAEVIAVGMSLPPKDQNKTA